MGSEDPEKTEEEQTMETTETKEPEEKGEKENEKEVDPVQQFEEQFKDRYSEKDELYTATVNAEVVPPPVITNWVKDHSRSRSPRRSNPESKVPGYYQFIY